MFDWILYTFDLTVASNLVLCTLISVVLGVLASLAYMFKNTYNKGFAITLAVLPVIVQMVIMLVNGEIGVGVAVMGAFGLVRFRSMQGSAREIGAIFLSMAMGLAMGVGNIGAAVLLLVVVSLMNIVFSLTAFGEQRSDYMRLKIKIPDDVDYSCMFDDVFKKYAEKYELTAVKTANLGSLFELVYNVKLKANVNQKEFIDALREKNDNLAVTFGKMPVGKNNSL
ncbi:MAG: DUF4956 domain-containing protein [Clostridia bacterium]|nr:DUF4956 domain-containing protein [Clostridia bacterium]